MKLPAISASDTRKRASDVSDRDIEAGFPDIREIPLPSRHDEPESSSAGFIAGVATGLLLGVVLSYLFGRGGGKHTIDQFVQRAESLKDSAASRVQQARDPAEGEASNIVGDLTNDVRTG